MRIFKLRSGEPIDLGRVVQLYLNRIKAYNGTCVNQPDGILGLGPITPIKNAHQLNALMTLNLRPARRERLGFDRREARSMTDPVEADPGCRTHWKWRRSDAYFASTGKLIDPLHRVVFAIKDQYDTFDLRTTVRHERKKPRRARCVYLFDR